MEPPAKRPRLGLAQYTDDDGDEISMDPAEFAARQDPDFQLQRSRHASSSRLKNRFEDIFEKYSKDFEDEADEIDLYTCEVVVDKGHLSSLGAERQDGTREKSVWRGKKKGSRAGEADDDSSDEEDRILHGKDQSMAVVPRPLPAPPTAGQFGPGAWGSSPSIFGAAGPPRLSSMFASSGLQFMNGPLSFGSFGNAGSIIDPRWQAPELPVPDPSRSILSHFGSGNTRMVPLVRKALPAPTNDADEEEDDILMAPAEEMTIRKNAQDRAEGEQQAKQSDSSSADTTKPVPRPVTASSDGNKENEVGKTVGGKQKQAKPSSKPRSARSPLAQPKSVAPKSSRPGRPRKAPGEQPGPKAKVEQAKKRKRGRPARPHSPAGGHVQTKSSGEEDQTQDDDTVLPDGTFKWGHPPHYEKLVIEILAEKHVASHELDCDDQIDEGTLEDVNGNQAATVAASQDQGPIEPPKVSAIAEDAQVSVAEVAGGETSNPSPIEAPQDGEAKESIETLFRNVLDSSFVFSDEEDGFVSKRTEPGPSQITASELAVLPQQEKLDEAVGETGPQAPMVTASEPALLPQQDKLEQAVDPQPPQPSLATTATLDWSQQVTEADEEPITEQLDTASKLPEDEPAFVMGTPVAAPKKRSPKVYSSKKKRLEEIRKEMALARTTPSKQSREEVSRPRCTQQHHDSTPKPGLGSEQAPLPDSRPASGRRSTAKEPGVKAGNGSPAIESPTITKLKSESRHTPLPKAKKTPTKTPSQLKTPASKISSIISISDSEDELSFGPDDFTPGGHVKRQSSQIPSRSGSVSPSSMVSSKRAAAIVSRKLAGEARSPLPLHLRQRASSPADSLLFRTPGGTIRRCGEDGYRCDRDYCFVCLDS